VGEDAQLASAPREAESEELSPITYGPLKRRCEAILQEILPGRAASIRAGLIVGPFDPTDRFTYWPSRIARGGEVLAPAPAQQPVQFIDARDLGRWTVQLIEQTKGGIFNAAGPLPPVTMGELLETCIRVAGSRPQLTWIDEDLLIPAGVDPWSELPLWVPEEAAAGFLIDSSRAVAAGLTFRPLSETVADTLAWDRARPDLTLVAGGTGEGDWRLCRRQPRAGLSPARESSLLRAWASRRRADRQV
jgi:2'-hydroxyisoflavone reductase